MIFLTDEHRIVFKVTKVFLLHHGRFADVIVGGNPFLVRQLRELPHVFEIVSADINVEEYRVSVFVLLANQVLEVLTDRNHRFGQARLHIPGIDREVEGCHAGIGKPVNHIGPHQSAVGRQVYPETLLGRVVDDLVGKVRTQ